MKKLRLWFLSLSLRRKLTLAFLLTILVAMVFNAYMYGQSGQIATTVSTIYESNISLSEMRETLTDMHSSLYHYLSGDYSSLSAYYTQRQQLNDSTQTLNKRPTDNRMHLTEKNIYGLINSYVACADSAIARHRGTDVAQYGADYEEAVRIYGYLQAYLNTLNEERFAENTVSYRLLLDAQRFTQTMNLLVMVLMTAMELLILVVLTRRWMQPLAVLSERALQVGHGQLELPHLPVKSRDEIGQVTEAFNSMMVRLNAYIQSQQQTLVEENRLKEEHLQLEALLKEAQLGALQAQINPHFLYNTLNAGSQLSMLEGAERTSQFLACVADYFRYNLRRSGKDVTLREELEQAENYLFIMNTRYAGEIICVRQLLEYPPQVNLPGMVLQPILENAISHGLHDIEGEKRLDFTVTQEPERVVVSVHDYGCGMPAELIEGFLGKAGDMPVADNEAHGIGLSNVISRLRHYFGRSDVLEIRSGEGMIGTEVRVLIPYQPTPKHKEGA